MKRAAERKQQHFVIFNKETRRYNSGCLKSNPDVFKESLKLEKFNFIELTEQQRELKLKHAANPHSLKTPRTSSDLLSSPQTPPPNRPADFQIKTSGRSNVVVLAARKTPRTKEFKLLEQNKVIPTHTQSKQLLALLIVNCRYLTDWLVSLQLFETYKKFFSS